MFCSAITAVCYGLHGNTVSTLTCDTPRRRHPHTRASAASSWYVQKVIASSDNWMVTYSAPSWCSPCKWYQSTLKRVAFLLRHDNIKVGWVNCDKARDLCVQRQIREYPTTVLLLKDNVESHSSSSSGHDQCNSSATKRTVVAPSRGSMVHESVDTVSWVRSQLPERSNDPAVVKVLSNFYGKYDPGSKSVADLKAISSKCVLSRISIIHHFCCRAQ